ncbi:uncharacterized protein LOC117122368 [Anneissia japonica]|uniref:uncharacterized protein LOC117122368 n=1 Tax=Anneissia japonica TaxID=1529436 RepID=UPI001425A17B|nr:uncharacterized protein LOC117122368 [Anneissia japonica]
MHPRMTSTYKKSYPNFLSFLNYRYILLYLFLELFILIPITWQYQDNRSCTSNQFLCKGGPCIPRNKKCDGTFDCFYNTDEIYCNDEYTIYFDVYYNTEIKTNATLIEPSVESVDACAEYCLKEKSFTCGSFDYSNVSKECRFSHIGSPETNQTDEDDILHFKLVPVIG